MSVESFRFQYTRRANQIELAKLDTLDQIYFHSQDFKWKNLGDVLDIGWIYQQAKFDLLIPKHSAAIWL